MRKTLSTVADGREPRGRRIAGTLYVLAVISMLAGFGVCVTGRMYGIALFLSGPVIAIVAFIMNTVVDIVTIRRTYRTDVERIDVLRGAVERSDAAVSIETLRDANEWTLQDLRRPLAYLVWHGLITVAQDTEGCSTIARPAAPDVSEGDAEPSSGTGAKNVDAVLHLDGESLILPSIEGALVAEERYRWRVAAKGGQMLGLLVMTLDVPNVLVTLSGSGVPFAFAAGLLLLGAGFLLGSHEQSVRSRMLRQIRSERDRIVYELLRGRETVTIGEIRDETGWAREELDDVLMRLARRKMIRIESGFDDADVVSIGKGRAK